MCVWGVGIALVRYAAQHANKPFFAIGAPARSAGYDPIYVGNVPIAAPERDLTITLSPPSASRFSTNYANRPLANVGLMTQLIRWQAESIRTVLGREPATLCSEHARRNGPSSARANRLANCVSPDGPPRAGCGTLGGTRESAVLGR